MSWIETIEYENAVGRLKKTYDRVKGPNGYIDNILKVHSLRPHTLLGHMALYKNVLHNNHNTLPKWLLESLGVWVSILNNCSYCIEHHFEGLRRLLKDDTHAIQIRNSLQNKKPQDAIHDDFLSAFKYAEKLTLDPSSITESHIEKLRKSGFDDGQILEVNQIVSYFCYANRTVTGLGVTTKGDTLGLSPDDSQNPDNWSHK